MITMEAKKVSLEEAIKLISGNDIEGYMEQCSIGGIRETENFWIFDFISREYEEFQIMPPGRSYEYIVNKSTGEVTSPGSVPTKEEFKIWDDSKIVYEKDGYYSDEDEDEDKDAPL